MSQDLDELNQSRSMNLAAHLARLARTLPDAVAFKHDDGIEVTYRELDARVNRLANALVERGVGLGDRVAALMFNRIEFIETYWAAWRLGAICVPFNFRLSPPELEYLLDDSGAKVLILDAVLDTVDQMSLSQPPLRIWVGTNDGTRPAGIDAYDEVLAAASDAPAPAAGSECDTAIIMYTSGTTGRPKGAMLTHGNLLMQSANLIPLFNMTWHSEVNLCATPLFHIAGIGSLLPTFLLGGHTVIAPLAAFDPQAILETVRRYGVTTLFLVPTQWQAVCALPPMDPPITSLRRISWGASPTSIAILEAMDRTFPGVANVAVFGQTEMSPVTCALDAEDAIRKIGSVGKPIPSVESRIVDAAMHDVPVGEVGEIVYRGPTLMKGYWNKPDETAAAFAAGWFHSGDLVRADEEGFIYVVDRLKDMIISGGENIYCAEVEEVIHAHPEVVEAAVIGQPHDKWGEVPIAIVVRRPDSTLTEQTLLEHCAGRLAKFKWPQSVEFVAALPRNASGKVTKHTLRADHAE
ncbi:long-chain-fatty-acid--CoA ligase [Antricoccus suffuscus]|nr:long-chain-fatty-acid--CoA ligase [Antricoccus suffuscus]